MNEQSVYNEDWITFNDKMFLILFYFLFNISYFIYNSFCYF